MKVKAIRMGYYGIKRRRPGAVFTLKDPKDFSANWMEKLDGKVKAPAVVVEPEEPEMDDEEFDEDDDVI